MESSSDVQEISRIDATEHYIRAEAEDVNVSNHNKHHGGYGKGGGYGEGGYDEGGYGNGGYGKGGYNVIAGLTAGSVVIPQGLAYAKLATLPPEYGLYSSFVGVSIYCFFSTSKDVTIGPTVVLSLLIGQAIGGIHKQTLDYTGPQIAASFALFSGLISLFLGLFRLGFLIEDAIPAPVVEGFTTGSAITISMAQFSKLFGISGVDTRKPTYNVFGKTLIGLPHTEIDVVFESPVKILKHVPSGLRQIKPPKFDAEILSLMSSYLPGILIILILEHIAIAKSFGRINSYSVNPSQELIAIGTTNALGSFFGAYPTTGSFVRTAIKSKSGVRTPLAGIFSGIWVISALYFLTPAFYYIPDATLAAVIIHAVLGLVSPLSYLKKLLRTQRMDFFIWLLVVIISIFFTVDIGIYVAAAFALLIVLIRMSRPKCDPLGRITFSHEFTTKKDKENFHAFVPLEENNNNISFKDNTFESPPPGVLIFQLGESLIYVNANHVLEKIINYTKKNTRNMQQKAEKKGDRPWNSSKNESDANQIQNSKLPILNTIIFDMTAVRAIDSTGIQILADIKETLNKFSGQKVEYHFANIQKAQETNIEKNERTPPVVNQGKTKDPWKIIKSLNYAQRITFLTAFLGWTLNAFDFFTVSFALPYIADDFKMKPSEIASSITITLTFRPVGALIFGQLADRYGRKYPLMVDILLYSIAEFASGFAPNFQVFIILRAIFGIAMGGEWGIGAALAMETLPTEARGLFSGILQQGYSTGYLIAAIFYYVIIRNFGWRAMFWIGSIPAILVIMLCFFIPESHSWESQYANKKFKETKWYTEVKFALKHYWIRIIHTVLLMACFNFMAHGTQDFYPTFLRDQLNFNPEEVTLTTAIASTGAIIGGTIFGFLSQFWGRRLTIIICTFFGICFLPLYVFPQSRWLLTFGAFMVYLFVQGAWGIIPAHLNELSPPEFRGTFPGLTYQLGNLIASSSAQIEALLGERFTKDGKPNYGLVQATFAGSVMVLLIFLIAIGKEDKEISYTTLLTPL
ncbi:6406_t:CDS:10 [Diversispora eburnea]|uniref:6406_t:CDS:1 n=1 Tax=Diversispora eburnea TaxID=1213867 RepID=A0A9N9FPD3_9GLOM|nr:6406_t:CDS:10 [Diversispora eburnea]